MSLSLTLSPTPFLLTTRMPKRPMTIRRIPITSTHLTSGQANGTRIPPPNATASRDLAPIADASAKPAPGETEEPAPARAGDPVTAQPSTVLVFKDGHQSDVLNYAIVGDTLFDLGAGRTRKILLADLDLPATHKANDERGVDFQIPASAKPQ